MQDVRIFQGSYTQGGYMLKKFLELYYGTVLSEEEVNETVDSNPWVELRVDFLQEILDKIEEEYDV